MKKDLYIRADGSASIGLGHIVRCMSLAHMLTEEFTIHFYVLEIGDYLKNEVLQNGWGITILNKEVDFLNALVGDEVVILDGYSFDSEYQKKVKKKGCKLVCIDDYHVQHFYADLVINHAPGISKDNYSGEFYTKYLLGPKYALLRSEFIENRTYDGDDIIESVKNIFICFGGSDSKNLTAKTLLWLPSSNYSVTVVLGNAYLHNDELDEVIRRRKDLEITKKNSLDAKDMRWELDKADLAIVPASGILFEVISSRLPVISGYYVDNQKSIYEGFKNLDCIIDAKKFDRVDFDEAIKTLNKDRLKLVREKQSQIIDGLSVNRFRKEFNNFKSVCA